MSNCLGIYLSDNIVKYARISSDNGEIKIEQCGTRVIKESKKELVQNLINETKSQDIPLVLNAQSSKYVDFEIYDQVQVDDKNVVDEIVKTEFEALCEKQRLNLPSLTYRYEVCEVKKENGKKNVVVNYTNSSDIEAFKNIGEKNVNAIYPTELVMKNIVPKTEDSYVLVNLDETLSVVTVLNGKFADFKTFDTGMQQVLEEFSIKLGSVGKAYESFKKINTFTEGESGNDPQLESILEPLLQEMLRNVLTIVNRNRKNIKKLFITGLGTAFTNIDILFQEYLDIKCEILKPEIESQTTDVRNISEIIESIQAVALANEYLNVPAGASISYVSANGTEKKKKQKIFASNKKFGDIVRDLKLKMLNNKMKKESETSANAKDGVKQPKVKKPIEVDFATESLIQTITIFCIVVGLILFTYLTFDQIYIGSINKNISDMNAKIDKLKSQEKEIESDINYTNTNMKKYKDINDQVSMVVSKIESNEIGKFSTYNVASFLQQIIKVIPKEVQLITISSDDNKNVTIVAESDNYSDLGYFVAQLKLQGILNSTKITNIENGERIKVTIGGELP